jgi:nucleoside-diphosphate-sugar epimerase
MSPGHKVLVAGASGVVGLAALRRFAAEPGWDVVGVARRPPDVPGVTMLALDLADRARCAEVLGALGDVTHVVYAALYEKPGLIPGWFERDQMQRNLDMFANLLDPLVAAGSLRHVSLLQGTKAYGAHVEPMRLPGLERAPRHAHENFYWLQEDHLRAAREGADWAFTILRPQIIFGEAQGSNMNAIPAFGVYAAVLRSDGEPLHYPGEGAFVTEAVDADLLARALAWAATADAARDETFNVTNGDVFVMENVWPALADAFGMEVGERRPLSLAATMPGRAGTWAEVVRRFDLRAPVDLERFVGQSFIYADVITGFGRPERSQPTLLSTVKIRRAGFGDCVDTEDMFRRLVASLQAQRLLPPRRWA